MWAYKEEETIGYDKDEPEWIIFSVFRFMTGDRKDDQIKVWNIIHNNRFKSAGDVDVILCSRAYYPISKDQCSECGTYIPAEVRLVAELIRC